MQRGHYCSPDNYLKRKHNLIILSEYIITRTYNLISMLSLTPVNISLLLISDSKKQMDNENTSSFTDGKEGFIIPTNNCIIYKFMEPKFLNQGNKYTYFSKPANIEKSNSNITLLQQQKIN